MFVTELADKDCIALTCGYYHSLALSADRCVWAWGWGVHGQLGFGNIEDYLVPARVTALDRCSVVRLAAGYSHSAVLTSEVCELLMTNRGCFTKALMFILYYPCIM